MKERFDPQLVKTVERELVVGVRVGAEHRFTAVWAVVFDGRIFARSWSTTRGGWRDAIGDGAALAIQVGGAEVAARALPESDEATNAGVDEAYRAKYHTPASAKYVVDMTPGDSRRSTVEFVPV